MAGLNLLKWLYKHSPVNFYSITDKNETIIKSLNNIFKGYKFDYTFTEDQINATRKTMKLYKRLSAAIILLLYFIAIYGLLFNNYEIFIDLYPKIILITFVIFSTFLILYVGAKLFEKYLNKNYGNFVVTRFPSSNFIENQSYKDFKVELVKIFCLAVLIFWGYFSGIYLLLGSPYETSLKLINTHKYEDAIKVTSFWIKIFPVDSQWYSMRGYSRYYTGDYKGAISDFNRAYNLEDDEYKSMNFDNKIFIMYQMHDYDNALKEFDKEIIKDKYDKNSYLWDKAQFLYNIKEYEKSLEIYNELIVNSEEDKVYLLTGRLYFERAQVYKKLKDMENYKQDIKMSQEYDLMPDFQKNIPQPELLLDGVQ